MSGVCARNWIVPNEAKMSAGVPVCNTDMVILDHKVNRFMLYAAVYNTVLILCHV